MDNLQEGCIEGIDHAKVNKGVRHALAAIVNGIVN